MARRGTILGFHGSSVEVRTFDSRFRRRGEYGDGFYFVDDPEIAEQFGPVVEAYELSIKHPLVVDQFHLKKLLKGRTDEKMPQEMSRQGAWITAMARQLGYDSIEVRLITGQRYYVVFDARQVRHIESGPAPEIHQGAPIKVHVHIGRPKPAF